MRFLAIVVPALVALVGVGVGQNRPERLEPPRVLLDAVSQDADSVSWVVRWTSGAIRGSPPTGWEWQADWSRDDSLGFTGELNGGGTVPLGVQSATFRSPNECGSTFYIHARVRAVGSWRVEGEVVTSTDWTQASRTWSTTCDDPPPEPPTVVVDTMAGIPAQSLRVGFHRIEAEPPYLYFGNQLTLGETVIICWYRYVDGSPQAQWPASCPPPASEAPSLALIPTDSLFVGCGGGRENAVRVSDGFDLRCGSLWWRYDPDVGVPQAVQLN